MKKKDLLARLNALEEENRRRGEGKEKYSKWNILLNTNTPVDVSKGYTAEYITNELEQIIRYLYVNLRKVIVINKPEHSFYKPFIQSCLVKYVIEEGNGRQKSDGTYPRNGGLIHSHVRIEITHNSNISLSYVKLKRLLMPKFLEAFGRQGFIGTPKLVSEDQSERYVTKSKKYAKGFNWVILDGPECGI